MERLMHPVFATVSLDLDELDQEFRMLQAAEAADLKTLSVGDSVQRWISKTSRASAVESLFTGMERVLKSMLSIMGEQVFDTRQVASGHQFHKQLIAQAAMAYGQRPPLISVALRTNLDQLRKFRHFERNSYGFSLDHDQLADILKLAVTTTEMFRSELRKVIEQLSAARPGGPDGTM
jgi:hypothetical protein